MAWFGRGCSGGRSGGLPEGVLQDPEEKVKLVVKSLVIEWPGLDGGLRRPIFSLPEGDLPDPEEKWNLN